MLKRGTSLVMVALVAIIALAACGKEEKKTPTPTPTQAAQPTPTTGAAVASPAASPVASPAASPVASPAASPTAAASPEGAASPEASPAASPAASPVGGAAAATEISVIAGKPTELQFDPSQITIPAGTDVKVTLRNEGALPHNFSIDALNISVNINPGETKEFTINASSGTYEFYCNVPGHKEAGMVGTLIAQ